MSISSYASSRVVTDSKLSDAPVEATPRIVRNAEIHEQAWDAYVEQHQKASLYHRIAWRRVIQTTFGKECYYLASLSNAGAIDGVLPLMRLNGMFLPDMLISLPYCNYGGVLADGPRQAMSLQSEAAAIADSLNCDVVELRNAELVEAASWSRRQDKVGMILELPASREALGKQLGSKRRSQIKRSLREEPIIRHGRTELVGDFYRVFSQKMHELGTPVYPRKFFENVAEEFADHVTLIVIYLDDRPVASAFLIRWRDTLEIPWAAADSAYNRQAVNMLLYWEALGYAIESECRYFDFGRSTRDAGTYRFKRQWGAEPVELPWISKSRSQGEAAPVPGEGSRMELAKRVWQRLPAGVAHWLGPKISPNLPW